MIKKNIFNKQVPEERENMNDDVVITFYVASLLDQSLRKKKDH